MNHLHDRRWGPGSPLDVTERRACESSRDTVEHALGPVDVLVHKAGIGPDRRSLPDMDPESFHRLVTIKVTGTLSRHGRVPH